MYSLLVIKGQMQHLILWGTDNTGLMSVGIAVCKNVKVARRWPSTEEGAFLVT